MPAKSHDAAFASGSRRPTQAVPLQPLERPVTLKPVLRPSNGCRSATRPFWSLGLRKPAPETGHAGKHLFVAHLPALAVQPSQMGPLIENFPAAGWLRVVLA